MGTAPEKKGSSMTTDQRQGENLPHVNLTDDGPRCGKFVAREGDQDLLCELPEGHSDSTPCSASLTRHAG